MDKARVKQSGKKTLKGICFGYVLRVGGGWSGDLIMADYEDLEESEVSEIYVKGFPPKNIRNKRIRIYVCKRNIETSQSSKTVIDSGGEPLARRSC